MSHISTDSTGSASSSSVRRFIINTPTPIDPALLGPQPASNIATYQPYIGTYHPRRMKGLVQKCGVPGNCAPKSGKAFVIPGTEIGESNGQSDAVDQALAKCFPWDGSFNEAEMRTELCRVCGWNVGHEMSGYTSRVRVVTTRDNSALWQLNSDWLVWDKPNDGTTNGNDYMSQMYLRDCGIDVPRVTMIKLPVSDNRFETLIMSRAKGTRLYECWGDLSAEQKERVSQQIANYCSKWRKLTAPRIQNAQGGQLPDYFTWCGPRNPPCQTIGYTEDEWLDKMMPQLRRGVAKLHKISPENEDSPEVDRLLQQLRDNFPRGGPYYFTHGDLNFSNIFVDDKANVTAIIDWQESGFMPWWAEERQGYHVPRVFKDDYIVFEKMRQDVFRIEYPVEEYDKAMEGVKAVSRAYHACPTKHTHWDNLWLRPPFCDCKPSKGAFRTTHLGYGTGHRIVTREEQLEEERLIKAKIPEAREALNRGRKAAVERRREQKKTGRGPTVKEKLEDRLRGARKGRRQRAKEKNKAESKDMEMTDVEIA